MLEQSRAGTQGSVFMAWQEFHIASKINKVVCVFRNVECSRAREGESDLVGRGQLLRTSCSLLHCGDRQLGTHYLTLQYEANAQNKCSQQRVELDQSVLILHRLLNLIPLT